MGGRNATHDHLAIAARGEAAPAPKLSRRALVRALERAVEPAQAAEARRQRDVRHRQARLVDQPLREVQPPRLRHGVRRRTHVLHEQPMQVARSDTDARGEFVHRRRVEHAFFDQPERAFDDGGRAEPGRRAGRRLGTTSQTRAEPGFGRRGSGRVVPDVGAPGARHRAHRPAVDARGCDGDEELSVEPRIAAPARAIERRGIQAEDRAHGSAM
jgi:hypothetical protein